jgi:peptidyl-prolyl cis-trans isomerase C
MTSFRSRLGTHLGPWASATSVVLLLLGLVVGCSPPRPPDPDLVAKIGSREIRTSEFQAWMQRRSMGTTPEEKVVLLNELLDRLALVERAKAMGLDRDPELMRAWDNLLVSKLRELQLEPQLTNALPSEDQIRSHYESNRAAFTEPSMRHGAVLSVESPKKMPSEGRTNARQRLLEARTKALAQATNEPSARGFGRLAVEYSEDQVTRYRGGDFGWVRADRLDSRFDRTVVDTLFALSQPGAVSDVIETERGCYLVKLLEIRPERVKPLETVETAIRHQLLLQNQQRLEAQWKQTARAALPTEIHTNVLTLISVPLESKTSTNPPALP